MKRVLLSLAACAVVAVAGVNEITPVVGGVHQLDADKFDDHLTYGIRVGLGFSKVIDQVEFGYDYSKDVEFYGGESTDINRLYLNIIKDFQVGSNSKTSIYGLLGLGHEDIANEALDKEGGFFGQYGLGFKFYPYKDFAVRAEIRHALKFKSEASDNMFYTLGFSIPFGGKEEQPVIQNTVEPETVVVTPPTLKEIYVEENNTETIETVVTVETNETNETVEPEIVIITTEETPVIEATPPAQQVVPQEKRTEVEETILKAMALSIPNFDPALTNTHRYFNFDFDSVRILEKDAGVANAIAKDLDNFENVIVKTEGHTDAVGSKWYNLKLSQKRANVVKNELIKSGISPSQIDTDGYGLEQPVKTNATEEGRAANRRVEVLFAAPVAYFDFDSAELKNESVKAVKLIADKLEGFDSIKVRTEGHTDALGSKWYNIKLSQKRAVAVKNKLVEYGITASRIETKAFGEDKPLKTNATEEGRAANRRVDILFINPNK
ncbi:MAG: OmpA family protein [Campylobacteraceae bacterium]|jgi:OOP family OmpA-OmpF porin|nr:OmpA family protein [Campylobacteraceae bacterium]